MLPTPPAYLLGVSSMNAGSVPVAGRDVAVLLLVLLLVAVAVLAVSRDGGS